MQYFDLKDINTLEVYITQDLETQPENSVPFFETNFKRNIFDQYPNPTTVIEGATEEEINQEIQEQLKAEAEKAQIELAQKMTLESVINEQQTLPDSDALEVQDIYPMWNENGKKYVIGEKCQHFNNNNELKLYKCVQTHTSQPDWKPIAVPALFIEIQPAGTIGVWVQPTGAQDAYQIDDLVRYPTINDPVYRSIAANNVWEPTVYGWVLN